MSDSSHVDSNVITTATDSTGATVLSVVQSNMTESSKVDSVITTGGKGEQGDTGPTGDTGPANSLSIGTVSGGVTASATITGVAPSQTLNLTLPKGDKGDTGAKGDTGSTGATGSPGAAATVSVGTTTTGAAGSSAAVTNSGTSSAAVLNFTIPRGADGDMLKSVYDPTSKNGDAFSMDNMAQGTTNKFVTAAEKTVLSNTSGTNTGDQTTITGNAGTATKLQTARTINGTSFDGSANITITAAGSTLSDAVTVAKGGSGRTTGTTAYGLVAVGTTATGAQQTISPGTSGQFLKSSGSSALASFANITESDVTNLNTDLAAKLTASGTAKITVGTSSPSSPATGDLWVDTN